MLKLVLIASLVYLAQSQSVHPSPHGPTGPVSHAPHASHGPHSPPPHSSFGFNYDGRTGEMVMVSATNCYLWALSDAQKMDAHDPAKIEALEFQLVALASDTTKQTVLTGTQSPDHWISAHCHGKTIVQVTA